MGSSSTRTVIVSVARTPFGKLGGGLAPLSAVQLGTHVVREALSRAKVAPDQVDQVILGQVLQAGAGQIPSRQAAMGAGLAADVPSLTVNKVCASGLTAAVLADQMLRLGEATVAVAGGMESMSQAPYLLRKAREGYRMGHGELVDSMIADGLWCAFRDVHMGVHGGDVAREFGLSREAQDAWAARSHQRAARAAASGVFAQEVAPVAVPGKKGATTSVADDEGIRPDTTVEGLAKLRPAFQPEGTITAGNAPGVNDGACALVLTTEARARELGLEPLAAIVAHAQAAQEPPYLATVPALAGRKALTRAGLAADQLDRLEINEAFAAVALISTQLLAEGGDVEALRERTNVHGGAIALGHPIGASGARILATLALELARSGGRYGMAAICSGAAQGDAVILENLRRSS